MSVSIDRLRTAYETAKAALLAQRTPEGFWIGELSTSALSTATAISALSQVSGHETLVTGGVRWLVEHQNADGGWGDTVKSFSNISTTMLCRAALKLAAAACGLAGAPAKPQAALGRAETWLAKKYGSTPEQLAEAARQRYGKDRTFSVPILMNCALAGLVPWSEVPALPFELACLPQSWYRFARMPVVSYALPALIAIGQAIFHHRPPKPILRLIRRWAIPRSLKVLERIQPASGGYLEAAPLTSFVVMALASCGRGDHPVAKNGVEFLVRSVRNDGSWPIDSNLSVWVTTIAVNALAVAGDLDSLDRKGELLAWLLQQQVKERHPYTGAEPGGWGWSHLSGSVPDCDDTAGALIAIANLLSPLPQRGRGAGGEGEAKEVSDGLKWLAGLQNRDGGFPTFCRGWGRLPFDRSGSDLTAHALRAIDRWRNPNTKRPFWPVHSRQFAALFYLMDHQRPDGSWLPLWFGNQHAAGEANPVYGTARVLAALRDLEWQDVERAPKAIRWLLENQNSDGGWGGCWGCPSTIEETALATEVLLDLAPPEQMPAVERGLLWLIERIEAGGLREPAPIGFYFAKLWYFEKMYPVVWSVAALGRALRKLK
ncbi:MAG TPA: prenyltransferase/squalene oxidase repeat-containing protein [Gemmataceae bacterium]|jgi:squalene-hopene/tetraprenyl-beta-curcumene cyclase|nr:prenyltransferase/squalene oxidase repeat-containing protein [Gemmataceae bacterium]